MTKTKHNQNDIAQNDIAGLLSPSFLLGAVSPGHLANTGTIDLQAIITAVQNIAQAGSPHQLANNVLNSLVEQQLQQAGDKATHAPEPSLPPNALKSDAKYADGQEQTHDVLDDLTSHEQRLREEAVNSERVARRLAQTVGETPGAIAQQEIRIQCAELGMSAGRFAVRNTSNKTAVATPLLRPGPGIPQAWWEKVQATFEPATVELLPNQAATLKLSIDLSNTPPLATDVAELIAEVTAQDAALLKVWVILDVIPVGEV